MQISVTVQSQGRLWKTDLQSGTSLAIPLDFESRQPNCFGTLPARREPWRSRGFVGSTRDGGSCNVDLIQLIPHCNGTHSESIAHIIDDRIPIAAVAPRSLLLAQLLSVTPQPWEQSGESYSEAACAGDQVITARVLRPLLQSGMEALILRTLPNSPSKRIRDWSQPPATPYLTLDAIRLLVEQGVQHLLIDLPSLDRGEDGGRLVSHHEFWGLTPQARCVSLDSRTAATITEMIFVPDSLSDGLCLLSLQIAPWLTDAAPCNPIVFPLCSSD